MEGEFRKEPKMGCDAQKMSHSWVMKGGPLLVEVVLFIHGLGSSTQASLSSLQWRHLVLKKERELREKKCQQFKSHTQTSHVQVLKFKIISPKEVPGTGSHIQNHHHHLALPVIMVKVNCCIKACESEKDAAEGQKIVSYKFPTEPKRRKIWIKFAQKCNGRGYVRLLFVWDV